MARDQRIGSISQQGAKAYTKAVFQGTGNETGRLDCNNDAAPEAVPARSGATLHEFKKSAPEKTSELLKGVVTGNSKAPAVVTDAHEPASTTTETTVAAGEPDLLQGANGAGAIEPGRQAAADKNSLPFPGFQSPGTGKQQNAGATGKRRAAAWMLTGLVAVAAVTGWLVRHYQDATPAGDSMSAEPFVQLPVTAIHRDESNSSPANAAGVIPAQREREPDLAEQSEAQRLQAEQELAEREAQRLEQQRRQAVQELAEREAQRLEQQRQQAKLEHEENQLEAKRAAAEAVLNKWSNAPEWSDVSVDKARQEYEARRAAAKAAWRKWSNTTGWADESGSGSGK